MTPENRSLNIIFQQFQTEGSFEKAIPFGSGHINDTFLVTTNEKNCSDYILQRINGTVFKNIPALMNNVVLVTQHVQKKLRMIPNTHLQRECLTVIYGKNQKPYFISENKDYWVCYLFIDGAHSYDLVENPQHAYEGGKTFGRFLNFLNDFPCEQLHETIPSFHNIEFRLTNFANILKEDPCNRAKEVKQEIDFVYAHAEKMKVILELAKQQKIPLRTTHNDTKFNNVLLDEHGKGLCVIDLDTVMPGYIHYDFSDAIRTVANTAAEDEKDLSKIDLNMHLFESFSQGFLGEIKQCLTAAEIESLPYSTSLLPFMIGLRFLTDHLAGDHYYKIHFPQHNLQRTRAQFQLTQQIEAKMPKLVQVINQITK